ncbi:MAG: RluA family pseudouridine synthase [Clostridia bacterium]|nr:RluA family pseudouridine synthase [Clostridia bacterium]
MKQVKITNLKKEEKLIYYIKDMYPNLATSVLHKALRNKDIKVNDKRVSDSNYILKNNDILQIYIDDYLLFGFPKDLDIAYEDDNILVVYKTQGLLSNNEGEAISEPTFEEFIKKVKGENIQICHRLDRNTSGLLIFAKNLAAYESMLEGFKNGWINKEYIAYVYGSKFASNYYKLESYLLKDEKDGYSKIYDTQVKNSQKIITEIYPTYKNTKLNYTILKVKIHTGKTHQIRAQLSAISHPIIGDSKYGKNEINKKFQKYKQLLFAVKYDFDFPENSMLFYLNKISIELDNKFYTNKI